MKEKKNQMRYNDTEIALIKNIFSENEELLKALRKHMLQLDITLADHQLLNDFIKSKPDVQALIRKTYLPTLDGDAPFHQLIDLWLTIKIEDKNPESIYPTLKAREILIKYLDQQLSLLEGMTIGKAKQISLDKLKNIKGKTSEEALVDLTARNTMISHNEMQLSQFLVLAGYKNETPEETMERLQKNSTK
jgi:hypothetical protein